MKKFYLIPAIALALGLSGCSDELYENNFKLNGNAEIVSATIDNGNLSRTTISENRVLWKAADIIGIFKTTSGSGYVDNDFKLSTGAGTTSAAFIPVDDFTNGETKAVAYFPYAENSSYDGTTLKTTVLSEYACSDESHLVMMGTFEAGNDNVAFKNASALGAITVNNVPDGYTYAEITAGDGEYLAGPVTITYNNGQPEMKIDSDGDVNLKKGTITITGLTVGNNVTLYFAIPVGNYANGITVTLKGEGKDDIPLGNLNDPGTDVVNFSPEANEYFSHTVTFGDGATGSTPVPAGNATEASEKLESNTNVTVTDITGTDATISIPEKASEAAATTHIVTINAISATGGVTIQETADSDENTTSIENLVVYVPTEEDKNDITIDMPNTTVTIYVSGSGTTELGTVTATTKEQTLIVGKGVTINRLNVKKGNVRVQGAVSEIVRDESNVENIFVTLENDGTVSGTIPNDVIVLKKEQDGTLILQADATLKECWELTENVTIDLNQKKLSISTGQKDVLRILKAEAVVDIKNGTIDNQNGNNYALSIRADNVTLNMENVTIPANDYDGSLHKNGSFAGCTVNLTGCEFNGIVYLSNEDDNTANTLTVTGGSFTSTSQNCFELLNTKLTMSGATLTNKVTEQSYEANGNEGNNFSKPLGYCIAFTNTDGVAATGSATLSNNTYSVSDADGGYIFNQMDGATLNMEVSRFKEFATVAAAGGEIKLLNDIENAEGLAINKNLVVDFNSKTYTMNKPGTGSAGTQTLGFQLLQGNNVTFKNGTINCSEDNKNSTWNSGDTEKGIAMMIQNYANLTLGDMIIDGTNIAHNGNNMRYIVSNNSGTVNLTGLTSITAPDGDVAFDVCKYASYTAPVVTVNTTGTITGLVEVSGGTLNVTAGTFSNEKGHCVKVVNGDANFNGGDFTAQEVSVFNLAGTVKITDGTFTSNDNAVISGNGSDDAKYKGGTIEISGGTFNAYIQTDDYVACGIYHPQAGTLKVTGGTFNIENGCGILMRGGELDMTGSNASFTFTGNAVEGATGKVGDSRVVVPCRKKIVKDAYSGYYDANNISITGVEAGDIYDVIGNQN